jgi:hypothetical protein
MYLVCLIHAAIQLLKSAIFVLHKSQISNYRSQILKQSDIEKYILYSIIDSIIIIIIIS